MREMIKSNCNTVEPPQWPIFYNSHLSARLLRSRFFTLVTQRSSCGEKRCVRRLKTAARETTSLPTGATLFGLSKCPYIHSDFNLSTTAKPTKTRPNCQSNRPLENGHFPLSPRWLYWRFDRN